MTKGSDPHSGLDRSPSLDGKAELHSVALRAFIGVDEGLIQIKVDCFLVIGLLLKPDVLPRNRNFEILGNA